MSGKALLRRLIREFLMNEIDIEDVGDICFSPGSTHQMQTCSIGGKKYYLKFSNEYSIRGVDSSLQVLVEYLAYRIYGLYKDVDIPDDIQLVYDKGNEKVGIATTPARGQQALEIYDLDYKELARSLQTGVYVDVLLANYDVIGTGSGNAFYDPETKRGMRLDPGASGRFSAVGRQKEYSPSAKELVTMLSKQSFRGAGDVFQHADLKVAAKTFLSVSLNEIMRTIQEVYTMVSSELTRIGLSRLQSEWKGDVDQIKEVIGSRHKEISDHAKYILEKGDTDTSDVDAGW